MTIKENDKLTKIKNTDNILTKTRSTKIVLGSSKEVSVASGRVENSCVQFVSRKPCAKLLEGFWITFVHFGLVKHPVLVPCRKINVFIFYQCEKY